MILILTALQKIVGAEQDISGYKEKYFRQLDLEKTFIASYPDSSNDTVCTFWMTTNGVTT